MRSRKEKNRTGTKKEEEETSPKVTDETKSNGIENRRDEENGNDNGTKEE